jgi:hypothetical protein
MHYLSAYVKLLHQYGAVTTYSHKGNIYNFLI